MDDRQKFIQIAESLRRYARGDGGVPEVIVVYRHNFLYGKVGRVVNYQRNMLIAVEFDLIQEVAHEYDNSQTFQNHQKITWWFLPPHLKIKE